MRFKTIVLIATVCGLSCSLFGFCAKARTLIADGRLTEPITVDSTGTEFFFTGAGGHSYSIEVLDLNGNAGLATAGVSFGGPNDINVFCPTSDGSGITHTESAEPGALNELRRVSYTIPGLGSIHYYAFSVAPTGVSTQVTVSVSDTTMYNPRWSTFSGFGTQWGFQNTTAASISGVLTVQDSVGGGPYTKNVTIAANSTVIVSTGDIFTGGPIPASHFGGARFTHNGPPGSIKGDAYFINGGATIIVPGEFKTVRENNH